ncbi:hypothetical protein GCM10010129_44900 [Streptomyces fumigatiscleroticus]|nr:hypothetical protein GCM10010129_44900 [Streptomyces fumigatiscleroticus]
MDVTVWATLDERAEAPRGDLLVHWFRTAMDFFFRDGVMETADSYAVVAESRSGGRDILLKDIRRNWPTLAAELRPHTPAPLTPAPDSTSPRPTRRSGSTTPARVDGRHEGRGGSHTGVSVALARPATISATRSSAHACSTSWPPPSTAPIPCSRASTT